MDEGEIYSKMDKIGNNIYEKAQQDLKEQDIDNNLIIDIIKPFLDDKDVLQSPYLYINNGKIKNKKKKKQKMKSYNIRKGDWQCEHCKNINFHFRNVCNVCNRKKDE